MSDVGCTISDLLISEIKIRNSKYSISVQPEATDIQHRLFEEPEVKDHI
jgi:hypothetical protein